MPTDAELLHRYIEERAEDAFAELVRRHLNLVYAAALRRTNGRHAMAEDVAQKVFTDLARKAAQLTNHPTLTGWLYRSTRYVAIDTIRIEQRREKLAHTLTAMSDEINSADSPADWEQLRPVIDEAMDQLKEQDREVMLLRFFQGLTFAEVGEKLSLSENAARMRTERALDKLRGHLGKRGVTSTTAALGLLLANQAFAQAPTGLATSVTTTALAAAPAGALATFFTNLLMNKIAITTLSAALAAGITTVAWAALADSASDADLTDLRAENARLRQATAAGAPATAVAAIADEIAAQTKTIVQTVQNRLEKNHAAGSSGHRNHGQASPYEAFLTYAWAIDTGDAAALSNILTYDEKGRAAIRALHAGMPVAIRNQYPTPEEFVVFLFIADTILRPIPGVDMAEEFMATETGPGRAVVRPKDAKQGGMNWVQTPEGWRCVVPNGYPEYLAKRILGNEMMAKLGLN